MDLAKQILSRKVEAEMIESYNLAHSDRINAVESAQREGAIDGDENINVLLEALGL